jgi:hypothetical protein
MDSLICVARKEISGDRERGGLVEIVRQLFIIEMIS